MTCRTDVCAFKESQLRVELEDELYLMASTLDGWLNAR
jgi:hypothetical protein